MTASDLWKGRNVLVTGCTGFLGPWLVEALLARGCRVVGLMRDATPDSRLFRDGLAAKIVLVKGNVKDLALMERIVGEYEIRTAFHLAAQSIVGIANETPVSTFESNVLGTWNLLEACRRARRVEQVVVASSDKAYGPATRLPYVETDALAGRTPYEVSKSAADLIGQSYWHTYRLPVTVVRCANLFGGGDLNFSRIVPGTIRSGLRGEAPVIRSDGKPLRDYLYVQDGALAYVHLAELMATQASLLGEAFNFSYEQPMGVLDFVKRILALIGREGLEPVVLNQAHGEIPEQYVSSEKARRMLAWRPTVELDDAITRTLAWYRDYFARR